MAAVVEVRELLEALLTAQTVALEAVQIIVEQAVLEHLVRATTEAMELLVVTLLGVVEVVLVRLVQMAQQTQEMVVLARHLQLLEPQ